jgi:hypothetical protein
MPQADDPDVNAAPSNGAPADVCGIVMPLSAIDDCNEAHWTEVMSILSDAITGAGLRPNLVSNADESGIIQKRIIQNLFDNPIVVCDVSGKNPNVMFELGIRLAFDKPTIVIKDDKTDYSFDTSPIEHIPYPRDLRFSKIVDFKIKLTEKIKATLAASRSDPNYTTFLKHFGEFKVANLVHREIGPQEYILEEISEIKHYLRRMEYSDRKPSSSNRAKPSVGGFSVCLVGKSEKEARDIAELVETRNDVLSCRLSRVQDHFHLRVALKESSLHDFDRIQHSIRMSVQEIGK